MKLSMSIDIFTKILVVAAAISRSPEPHFYNGRVPCKADWGTQGCADGDVVAGLWRSVDSYAYTNVSEKPTLSIFRAEAVTETLGSAYDATWRHKPEQQHRHVDRK
jgi:hypothetical protein